MWAYKWSDHVKSGFYEKLVTKGNLDPKDLEPPLGGLEFYIEAFFELFSCRGVGLGPGPIPFTAIHSYASIYGIEDFDEFHFYMRLLDKKFLELDAEERKKSQATKAGNNVSNKQSNHKNKN